MPFIKTTYDNIINFFKSPSNKIDRLPDHLKGIWSLEKIGNMSIFMSLENAQISDKRIIVKLYKKGNWLFKEENIFTKYIFKLIKYSYQFDFNDDYTYADIYIKLGSVPFYFPKSVMDWSLTVDGDKMIRKTKMFGKEHTYETERVSDDIVKKLNDGKINKLYYV
jgi:hypothetical protein